MPSTPSHEPYGRGAWAVDDPTWGWDATGHPVDAADGWRPVPSRAAWMTEADREAWLEVVAAEGPPPDPELDPGWFPDPDDPALPSGIDPDELRAQSRRIAAEQAAAAEHIARLGYTAELAAGAAGALGRRGPGQPGSAHRFPGEYAGPAGGFAAGQPLDTAPGGSVLLGLAEYAAGDDDRFAGASDDELTGIIAGLDRAEAAACSLKHAAVAELIRRRPAPGAAPEGPARLPAGWDPSAEAEVSYALAEYRGTAQDLLGRAHDLETRLPGTRAAFRAGVLRLSKVEIICRATALLDADEARAAEEMVLGRAGQLTPAGLRSAITRAVMQVAPGKARKRREDAARRARVERRPEYSGNAALAGRELPPAQVLAADQRITWWATQLKQAGAEGSMDQLRAQAYLDLLLNTDSRPAPPAEQASDSKDGNGGMTGEGPQGPGDGRSGPPHPAGPPAPPGAGVIPAGFIGRVNLTVPLTTLLGLADRPGEIPALGPLDPWLARDLARAAAANPKTTWCLIVTDQDGHAIGHGCARPGPRDRSPHVPGRPGPRPPGGSDPPPGGNDPPGGTARPPGPGFSFTPQDQPGPAGGYGAWRFTTGTPGQPGLLLALDPIPLDTCDHRYEGAGHDPGVKLRHLTEIRHATCTGPTCRRPAARCDFEHNTPYEAGGRTCMCNGGPKCRHEHRLKQDPRWKVEQPTPGTFRWTTPSGRQYTTEPTRYPI